jgi:14-3-3 protein epsilon
MVPNCTAKLTKVEMMQYMSAVARENIELTVKERNLLCIAYRNSVGARRMSWRVLSSVAQRERETRECKEYAAKIMSELCRICDQVLDIVSNHALPHITEPEASVFFTKMLADFKRYKIEVLPIVERTELMNETLELYERASDIADQHLRASHPTRLGVALNFSVFLYEIMNDNDRANRVRNDAFNAALSDMSMLSEESYKESTLIMQLLR